MRNYNAEQVREYRNEMLEYQKKLICPFMTTANHTVYCKTTTCAAYDDEHIECSIKSICRNFNGEYDD